MPFQGSRLAVLVGFLTVACSGSSGTSTSDGSPSTDGGPDATWPDTAPRACHPFPAPTDTWEPARRGPDPFTKITLSPSRSTVFAIGSLSQVLLRSDDGAVTWCHVPTPGRPELIAFAGGGDRTLYLVISAQASAPDGGPAAAPTVRVLRSDDGGDSWMDPGGTLPGGPAGLWPLSSNPLEMVAGLGELPQRLWVTRDGGQRWEAVAYGRLTPLPQSWSWIAPHPTQKGSLYGFGRFQAQPIVDPYEPWLLWRSDDQGHNWKSFERPRVFQDALVESDGRLLALDINGNLLARDGQATEWTMLGAGFSATNWSIRASFRASGAIYFTHPWGGGLVSPLVVAGRRGILAMTAARPGMLFYLGGDRHVFQVKADDATMVADLGAPAGALSLMFDPKETDLLYAGGSMLYRRKLP
jgi:hypothetical protein